MLEQSGSRGYHGIDLSRFTPVSSQNGRSVLHTRETRILSADAAPPPIIGLDRKDHQRIHAAAATSYVDALRRQRQAIADRVISAARRSRASRVAEAPRGTSPKQSPDSRRSRTPSPRRGRRSLSPKTRSAIVRLHKAERASRYRIMQAAESFRRSLAMFHSELPTDGLLGSPPRHTENATRRSPQHPVPESAPFGRSTMPPQGFVTVAAQQQPDAKLPVSASRALSHQTRTAEQSAEQYRKQIEAEISALQTLRAALEARDRAREEERALEQQRWSAERASITERLRIAQQELQIERSVSESLRAQLRLTCRTLRPLSATDSPAT